MMKDFDQTRLSDKKFNLGKETTCGFRENGRTISLRLGVMGISSKNI